MLQMSAWGRLPEVRPRPSNVAQPLSCSQSTSAIQPAASVAGSVENVNPRGSIITSPSRPVNVQGVQMMCEAGTNPCKITASSRGRFFDP